MTSKELSMKGSGQTEKLRSKAECLGSEFQFFNAILIPHLQIYFRVWEYRNFIFCGKIRCYFWPTERIKIWRITNNDYKFWKYLIGFIVSETVFCLSVWCVWGGNEYVIKPVNTTKCSDSHHVLWESITVTFGRFLCATFNVNWKVLSLPHRQH